MKHLKKLLVISLSLIFYSYSYSLVVGSNTALLRQGSTFFPASDTDNTILGFVAMQNGFTLQDSTTTVTFDAFFPMTGTVILNGGNLFLNQDLMADNVTTLTSIGNIYGSTHQLSLSSYLTTFGAQNQGLYILNNADLLLNNDITFNSNFKCQGNCIINGNGNILSLSSTASFLVDSNSTLEFRNIVLKGLQNTNISCVDDTGILKLNDTTGILLNDFSFPYGSISINNDVTLLGSKTFNYQSSQTSTVNQNSTFRMTTGVTLAMGRYQDNALAEPLGFVDQTSIFALENCTLWVNSHGMGLTKGKIQILRDVAVSIHSTSTVNGLILGDGIVADDLAFELFPAATITYSGGHVLFNLTQANIIRSLSTSSKTIRLNNTFYINQNITLSNATLQQDSTDVTIIAPGKTISYSNLTVSLPFGTFQATATSSPTSITLANGQSITVLSGFFVLPTVISGTGNTISGNGIYSAPIILQNSSAALTWSLNGPLKAAMTMNGGSLTLSSNLILGNLITLSGTGVVHINGNNVSLGAQPLTWSSQTYWNGTNGGINMNGNVRLDNVWTFSGQCTINGNGRTLDLVTGTILVERGSTLNIKNATLKNIWGSNIRCLDNAATVVFDNVTLLEDTMYTFSTGAMQIANNTIFRGVGNFVFQSPQPLTIQSQASLTLDQGLTFSYDPVQNLSPNLLIFTDSTSRLNLTRSTLYATLTGLNLTKGSMLIRGSSIFYSEKQTVDDITTDNGITLGDGLSSANDFECDITAGAQLQVTQGSLNYKNVNTQSWIMENINSVLFMNELTKLRLYQVMNLGIGIAQFGNNAVLARASGTDIIGTILPLGNLIYDSI